jgi:hypothetical protein
MSEPEKPPPRLRPARPDLRDDESAAYMPRLPWRWILLGTLSVATVTAGFMIKEQHKAEALRSQLVQVHEQELAEPARRYVEFREKLEKLIMQAAEGEPETFADKRLHIPGLRSGKGLYMRIRADQASDPKQIEKAALTMEPDVIASCMGLAPASARGLWEKGQFLMPGWLEEQREEDRVMHLRVADETLARHIRADLPAVLNLIRSDWFLLVLQHGEDRRSAPVDVFLWDLRRDKALLSTRVQSRGVLLGARIRSQGKLVAGPGPDNDRLTQGSANDCSIASQVKQLAGMPAATVEHAPEVLLAADGGVPDAGSAEAPGPEPEPEQPATPTIE